MKTSTFLQIVVITIAIVVFSLLDADIYSSIYSYFPYDETNSFAGKIVWITGASSGML
jgi:uncharacterized membrane protein (DUF373 family)